MAVAAAEDITAVGKELQNNQTKRWQTVGMLKHVFSCARLSWDLKRHALDFFLSIMKGCECHEAQDEQIDCFSYMPSLHAGLLVICFFFMFSNVIFLLCSLTSEMHLAGYSISHYVWT